jgi:anti-sigma factor RsiW
MECKEIFARLSEYLDLDLPEGQCEEIRRHIEGCGPCVAFVESLEKSVELCRGFASTEAAGPLQEEAQQQLRAAYEEMLQSRAAGRVE